MRKICSLIAFAGLIWAFTADGLQAQIYTDLYNLGTNPGDPVDPQASGIIAQGRDGNLYSTTPLGGTSDDGAVFKITPQGNLTVLYSFDGTQGTDPCSGLTLGTDGNFYGTTNGGGSSEQGTVFRITPAGELAILHSFDYTDGAAPLAPPIQGFDGNFYGTTHMGGTGYGTVYKMTPSGSLTILHSFDDTHGAYPYGGLVLGTDGNFYGTAEEGGTDTYGVIYRIAPNGDYSVLHDFENNSGTTSQVTMLQHTMGTLYGETGFGGTDSGGVVYSLNADLRAFAALIPRAAKVGKTIDILGQGFTGVTAVSFNGISALFTVVSSTFLKATVPAGATIGLLTVTTPSGVLMSKQNFQILP